ncbi:hypothetical protein [Flavisericum labens]|uniref:hypothetical protein n=1 Tax=Flavisericum labens TaxID=3377112 RepID=UPI00387B6C05
MSLKAGDFVLVLDEALSGRVKAINGNSVTIETDEGFLLNFESHELVKKKAKESLKSQLFSHSNINSVISEKEQKKINISPKRK